MFPIVSIQVGKNGIPENLAETLQNHFKNHQNVKIVFLKTSFRDKNKIKAITENILSQLGANYTYRLVGFTVFIKKWRKDMR